MVDLSGLWVTTITFFRLHLNVMWHLWQHGPVHLMCVVKLQCIVQCVAARHAYVTVTICQAFSFSSVLMTMAIMNVQLMLVHSAMATTIRPYKRRMAIVGVIRIKSSHATDCLPAVAHAAALKGILLTAPSKILICGLVSSHQIGMKPAQRPNKRASQLSNV